MQKLFFTYNITSESDIISAREEGRRIAREIGFPCEDQTRITTAISEVAKNIVDFAESGEIAILIIDRDGNRGIEIKATDKGPGIDNMKLAMIDGYSTSNRRGLGLPGVRRLMDEFEVSSDPGMGTSVVMRMWRKSVA